MTKQEYMTFHEKCCQRMVEITKKKNSDYTGGSLDPFANFTQIGSLVQVPSVVEIGFVTRMSDKLSRIGSFITKGFLLVKDESVEDTLLDLANYCILFAGYLRSKRVVSEEVVDKILTSVDMSKTWPFVEEKKFPNNPISCTHTFFKLDHVGARQCSGCGIIR